MPTLYPFQHAGVRHLLTPMPSGKHHKLLAWGRGTGKTIIACEAIKRLQQTYMGVTGLVITPAGLVKYQWLQQMRDWGVLGKVYVVESSTDTIPGDADHIICNYELLLYPHILSQLHLRNYTYIALDEAQRCKDPAAQITELVFGYNKATKRPPLIARGKYKWLLSGTIAPNRRPIELYPAIRTLVPEVLGEYLKHEQYGRRFCGWLFRYSKNEEEFKERTKDFISHVRLEDVFDDLPELAHSEHYIDLGHEEEIDLIQTTQELATIRKFLGELMIPHVIEYLKERAAEEPEEKFTVFCWTRNVIEALHAAFPDTSVTIYGATSAKQKVVNKSRFVSEPNIKFLIAQIKAAGTGVDGLQSVCRSGIIVEPDWSWGDDDQLMGRLHRIGQWRNVHFTRLLAVNTLHETIHHNRNQKTKFDIFNKHKGEQMIETKIDELIAALNANTAALKNGHGNATAAEKQPTAQTSTKTTTTSGKPAGGGKKTTAAKKLSVEDIRTAVRNVVKTLSGGGEPSDEAKAEIKTLLTKHGATSIDNLKEAAYETFLQDVDALLAADAEEVEQGEADEALGF